MNATLFYVTCKNEAEASKIAKAVIAIKLAACANIFGKVGSFFRWEGEVQEATEAVLILKTTKKNMKKLCAKIKELHSYDCPCIIAIPITGGSSDFARWIDEQCS